MTIFQKDRIGALIVFVFCAGAWSMLDSMPPEAAFFPRLILGLAFGLGVLWVASTFLAKRPAVEGGSESTAQGFFTNPKNFAVFTACLVAYIALIDLVGYFTSTALFILTASFALGFRKPLAVIGSTAGFVLFIYVVFVLIFQRPLPIEFFQPQ